ncbi:MAG: septal ring lytic transglycosylase RlpA family protein [Spirosomaceae bacterium]|nr:septal ring lytic transglycosylase RlpA family protein [Spirosomataceae bacterium]
MKKVQLLVLLSTVLLYISCHSQNNCCPEEMVMGDIIEGKASYYGPRFHGKTTANGEKMDKYSLTAAHKTLPFGTMLEVTNLANGKRVVVRINDRGPYSGSRIIDISLEAAKQIGMIQKGIQRVQVMTIGCCGEIFLNRVEDNDINVDSLGQNSTSVQN